MSILLFDIGGTKMRLALCDGTSLSLVQTYATPKDPEEAIKMVLSYISISEKEGEIERIVGGVAGTISDGIVQHSPNLPEWNGVSFGTLLAQASGVSVSMYNDADLAGLGEAVYGAGKEAVLVGYLGIGTGVGGTLIHNKRIVPFVHGLEPGKQIIDHHTGKTLEDAVSGAGIQKETGELSESLPRSFYEERTVLLATGIYNTVRHWSPDVLVLGGSLMNEETAFRLLDVQTELARIADGVEMPTLAKGILEDQSGLYGALAIATQ
ncbi:ROK family protein [Patescibacteria group bacterium]|nr:ROK family protein [Patescibacteria group bacterium]MBU2080735.1 ROK family protein [Patescibacteria group bacterium]MBU2123840.1 ROK family protein [Patescibacteria group bacterium]MBU2194869.1 ROK family protein [Patescibacteria group bacterium]